MPCVVLVAPQNEEIGIQIGSVPRTWTQVMSRLVMPRVSLGASAHVPPNKEVLVSVLR